MSPVNIKVSGVWKPAVSVHTKVAGAWKTASDMPVKISGIWKTGILASNAFESIATVSVGAGGSSTITFSSIPSTYTHLQIRGILRGTNASTTADMSIKINGSTSNGGTHILRGTGAAASANGYTAYIPFVDNFVAASSTASVFSGIVIDILDYLNTNKYKTVRSLSGYDANGSGYVTFASNLALDTTAVSSVVLSMNSGNFAQYSHFALYGIKGA